MAVPVAAIMALVKVLVNVGQAAAAQAKTPYDTQLEQRKADLERFPGLDPAEYTQMEGQVLDPVLAAISENQSKAEATLAAMGATTGADLQMAEEAKAQYIKDAVSRAAEQLMSADVKERKLSEKEVMAINKAQEQRKADKQAALWAGLGQAADTAANWAAEPENIAAVTDVVGQARKAPETPPDPIAEALAQKRQVESPKDKEVGVIAEAIERDKQGEAPAATREDIEAAQIGGEVMGLTDEQLRSLGLSDEDILNFRNVVPTRMT